jgi:non-ribosomal peptide synthase protein (TIGR01720 family)
LIDYSNSSDALRQADYWLANASEDAEALPVDYSGGINSEGSTRVVSVSLDEEETTAILREIPEAYRTQIDDVLLAALALAFAQQNGSQKLLVDIESHGRHDLFPGVDLSRTVGWFTAIFPLLLDVGDWLEPGQAVKAVKEQLRRLPQHGIGYGLLRYLCDDAEVAQKLGAQPGAQVSFNYLGQFDQVFSSASLFEGTNELSASSVSPRAARAHLLDIIGRVAHGRLQFSFRYSENAHRRATIEQLGQYFLTALRSIITHCLTDATGGLTPSDFPDVELSQEELDDLMTQFG